MQAPVQQPLTLRIVEFPQDGAPWRLDGLGALVHAGTSRSEALITVCLSQLREDYDNPLHNPALSGPSLHVLIKVGLIAVLKLGSVWVNGQRMPARVRLAEETLTLRHDHVELHRFGSRFDFEGDRIPVLGARRFAVGEHSWHALRDSWLAVVRWPRPNIPYLVIPCAVIFQKCFALSSTSVARLAWGELSRIVDTPRWMHLHGEDSGNPTTFSVEAFKEIRTRHAYAFANVLADPVANAQYEQFRRTLVAAQANLDASRKNAQVLPHIRFGLPFSNPVSVQVRGKRLPLSPGDKSNATDWGFLVTEIVSLDTQLLFERLLVHRKNDGRQGENADSQELEEAWGAGAPPPLELGPDDLDVHSGIDPAAGLDTVEEEEAGGFNPVGLELIDSPKELQAFKRLVRETTTPDFDGQVTTGEPETAEQGSARLDVLADEAPATPVTLEVFLEAIALVRELGYIVQVPAITSGHRLRENGDAVNFLPRQIKGCRSWHLIPNGNGESPRGYIVARVKAEGVWHHFIELERKTTAHALAHIKRRDGDQIGDAALRMFMVEVAQQNGWDAARLHPTWITRKIWHLLKKGGVPAFAALIARALAGAPDEA